MRRQPRGEGHGSDVLDEDALLVGQAARRERLVVIVLRAGARAGMRTDVRAGRALGRATGPAIPTQYGPGYTDAEDRPSAMQI